MNSTIAATSEIDLEYAQTQVRLIHALITPRTIGSSPNFGHPLRENVIAAATIASELDDRASHAVHAPALPNGLLTALIAVGTLLQMPAAQRGSVGWEGDQLSDAALAWAAQDVADALLKEDGGVIWKARRTV